MNRLENINNTYSNIKNEINKILSIQGFIVQSDVYEKELFGSKFCTWLNKSKKLAFRIIWNGRDSLFILEESPYITNSSKYSWADIGVFPFNANDDDKMYQKELAQSIANELK